MQAAIDATRKGGRGGFADHLIAQVGFANGCREAVTFDGVFGRGEKVRTACAYRPMRAELW